MRTPLLLLSFIALCVPTSFTSAKTRFSQFQAHPPIHAAKNATAGPVGLTPAQIKSAYRLPPSGGSGTIAIIGAYNARTIENDLGVFSATFGLPACTIKNGCLEIHKMSPSVKYDGGWALETSLDVEWSHAIAPTAKILLVEAATASGANLLSAIDYARARPDVVAVSMSWGGAEFSGEATLDSHFTSGKAAFFAASGDQGTGVSWPASSPNVVGVGGTTVLFAASGAFKSESAWPGSGGGVSAYEPAPDFQKAYAIKKSNGMRSVPDVSYDADPNSGFPVYKSGGATKNSWITVGGTSAGAPQWAAIRALGLTASNQRFYVDKASVGHTKFFRDITSGMNGTCGYYCDARKHYDFVTGLGSPLTVKF